MLFTCLLMESLGSQSIYESLVVVVFFASLSPDEKSCWSGLFWETVLYHKLSNKVFVSLWGNSHGMRIPYWPALNLHAQSVSQSCPTPYNPMDCSPPGSSVHEFPKQEYWSGLPFPSPGNLPNPGIKPKSLESPALQANSLLPCHLRSLKK